VPEQVLEGGEVLLGHASLTDLNRLGLFKTVTIVNVLQDVVVPVENVRIIE
jgi:hypothetical protein